MNASTLQAILGSFPAQTLALREVQAIASSMPEQSSPALPQTPTVLAEQFMIWRQDNVTLAPLMAMMPDDSLPCEMAAVLAAVPSNLPFHNHHHIREVTCLAMALADKLPVQAREEVFVAACIHDFAHDGLGNRRHDQHAPMRLERKSLEAAYPYLKASGLSDTSWLRIRAMVLATDVSKNDSSATSPAEWLRRACEKKSSEGCPAELLPLFADPSLAHQAALLEDADLGTSAGMPYDHARRMTALIAQETGVLAPTPQTLIGFINHICHGSFITPEAHEFFGDSMQAICEAAERESADTIYNWS